jgi:hypothetical protein
MIKMFTGRQVRGMLPTVLVYAVLALVVYLLIRMVKKGFSNVVTGIGDALNTDAQDQLNSTTALDGTSMTADEIQAFKSTAKQVADSQELALYETGFFGTADPDEDAIFRPLFDYNGAQLREIYKEYGQRNGKTLFETYQTKLNQDTMFSSLVYWDDSAEGCTSYFDQCYEVDFARALWMKSGIPISF